MLHETAIYESRDDTILYNNVDNNNNPVHFTDITISWLSENVISSEEGKVERL